MSEIVIRTNNVPRDLIDAWQLTPKERAEFDYLDWPAIDDGRDSATFFRYKGDLTSLDQVERIPSQSELAGLGWNGQVGWSWSSGLLFKFAPDTDNEQCIIAYFYVKG